MAGWPSLDPVDDRRLAQDLRTGEPHALGQVFDAYAPRLYDYCHALLRDQDEAATALGDSLIAAQEHIVKLREPERLRSWLYAIVRNACLRRMIEPDRPPGGHEAPEVDDAFLDSAERERREDTRRVVHSALSGLSGRQREAVDLTVRHDLDLQELAGVLGISGQQANELVAQARGDLDNALAAAIIARTGRADCPSVAALVDERDWPLSPDTCRKLVRHIEVCPVCAERRKRKVSTNRLLQLLPVAALPPELRPALLGLASAPDRHEARTVVAQRAEPFDVWGWPVSADKNRSGGGGQRRRMPWIWPAAGAAACVILIVAMVFLLVPGSKPTGHARPQAAPVPSSADPSSVTPTVPETTPSARPTSASPTPTPTTSSPAPPAPHRPRPGQPRPSRSHLSPPPPPPPATLSAQGCNASWDNPSCAITLTASGGTVHWSVSYSGSNVSAAGSGTLSEGGSTTVTATVNFHRNCFSGSETVPISPGASATVTWTC